MKQTIDGLHIEGIRKRVLDEVFFVYRKVSPRIYLKIVSNEEMLVMKSLFILTTLKT